MRDLSKVLAEQMFEWCNMLEIVFSKALLCSWLSLSGLIVLFVLSTLLGAEGKVDRNKLDLLYHLSFISITVAWV